MELAFDYVPSKGKPRIGALVFPSFHHYGYILWNYTEVAHKVLHMFDHGWSDPIRLARGIVFDRTGKMIALPFPKFFGFNERTEPVSPDLEAIDVREKLDGHLGIIFFPKGKPYLTTRGSFHSQSAQLGRSLLRRHVCAHKQQWNEFEGLHGYTLLVEIIHPKTRVLVEYPKRERRLVLIGAYETASATDCAPAFVDKIGERLGLAVAPSIPVRNVSDLVVWMRDRSVRNREGFVARYASDEREKFKFEAYVGQMIAGNIDANPYQYLMKRILVDDAKEKVRLLDPDVADRAQRILKDLMDVRDVPLVVGKKDAQKSRRMYLHRLVPQDECSAHYKTLCREFLRYIAALPTTPST